MTAGLVEPDTPAAGWRLAELPAGHGPRTVEARGSLWGMRAEVLTPTWSAARDALGILAPLAGRVDAACSRFRPDSELMTLPPDRFHPVSPLLWALLTHALDVARSTDGLVDPTVGASLAALGYDRDLDAVLARRAPGWPVAHRAGEWARIGLRPGDRAVRVPAGTVVDLGSSAKSWLVDRVATRAARATGRPVLVDVGGDLRAAGPARPWPVAVADDHRHWSGGEVVEIRAGGLATSGLARRRWDTERGPRHHIVDPRTGENPAPCWRTVSVVGRDCSAANAASTAALVLGPDAPDWLAERGLPARLVALDGTVTRVAGWPEACRSAA